MFCLGYYRMSSLLKKCYTFLGVKGVNFSGSLRSLSVCSKIQNKYIAREGRVMRKMLNHSSNRKKAWHDSSKPQGQSILPIKSTISQGGRNHRRIAVLNKLFMTHITDLMASGEIASMIVHRGIEITKVKVAPDITNVSVFWLAKGSKHDEDTEKILSKYAGQLRHELAQLRLIGYVPALTFVKDKDYDRLVDVDKRLAVADFGEDYVPTDPSHHLKSEFILNTQFSPRMKDVLERCQSDSSGEDPLPAMRMDVFGVNQLEIINKVKKMMKRSEAPHRSVSQSESPVDMNQWPPQSEEMSVSITEHFIRQQLNKQKYLRDPRNYQPEGEMQATHWENSYSSDDEKDHDIDYDNTDYFSDSGEEIREK